MPNSFSLSVPQSEIVITIFSKVKLLGVETNRIDTNESRAKLRSLLAMETGKILSVSHLLLLPVRSVGCQLLHLCRKNVSMVCGDLCFVPSDKYTPEVACFANVKVPHPKQLRTPGWCHRRMSSWLTRWQTLQESWPPAEERS